MALERRDPLPPGFYWIDVWGEKDRALFNEWARSWEGVTVRKTQDYDESHGQVGTWYLFEITKPTIWLRQVGFPTIAEKGMATTQDDTVQRPDPEDPIGDILDGPSFGTSLILAGGLGVGLWLLLRKR